MGTYVYSLRKKAITVKNQDTPVFVSEYAYKPYLGYHNPIAKLEGRIQSLADKANDWAHTIAERPEEGWLMSQGGDHGSAVYRMPSLPTTHYDEIDRPIVGYLIKSKEGRRVVWSIEDTPPAGY